MGEVVRSLRLHGGLPIGTAVRINNALAEIFNVKMDDAPDVVGTQATVGFQITDFVGDPINFPMVLEFAVFNDMDLTIPSSNAKFGTAVTGLILYGSGSPALKVKTDPTGRFLCLLNDLAKETVFLGCSSSFGTTVLDCREMDSVTFS